LAGEKDVTDLVVYGKRDTALGRAAWKGVEYPALLGRAGVVSGKREGDGGTPLGRWPLLQGFYRADRIARPSDAFDWRAIVKGDCFCDEAGPDYNRFIPADHPLAARYGAGGTLWKEGHEYDALFSLGYNTDPVAQGAGSAILLHGWREGATHSGGCVALPNDVLLRLAGEFMPGDGVDVREG
jgi:L,D-peptidoglycan transpeptidase YkuD (ErfK/YbiS/YcfS/YnhG family)